MNKVIPVSEKRDHSTAYCMYVNEEENGGHILRVATKHLPATRFLATTSTTIGAFRRGTTTALPTTICASGNCILVAGIA